MKGASLLRKILSLGANSMLKVLFPIPDVYTYSSFYRAYRVSTLKKADIAFQHQLIKQEGLYVW